MSTSFTWAASPVLAGLAACVASTRAPAAVVLPTGPASDRHASLRLEGGAPSQDEQRERGLEDDSDLAQELTNPLADLMTVPIQVNYDQNLGPLGDGTKWQTNVQPVIPIQLSEDWNLITRTIVPVIHQDDVFPGAGSQSGLGDITLSLFASPREPTDGWIWGAGTALLLPTATDSLLGAKKWAAGPSAVALTMRGPWTVGMLGNHVWSFAGDGDRPHVDNTFLQPFAAYTWPSAWTLSAQSESTYNWRTSDWAVPITVAVAKLVYLGPLPVSLAAGLGYWLESPDSGPDELRLRLQANFVLPKPF